jgi:hypothetical protein
MGLDTASATVETTVKSRLSKKVGSPVRVVAVPLRTGA